MTIRQLVPGLAVTLSLVFAGVASAADNFTTSPASSKPPVTSKTRTAGDPPRSKKPPRPRPYNKSSEWADVASWPDPIKPYVDQFLKDQKSASISATTVTRLDYIKLAADNVTFWTQYQNADGAIIDPFRKEEWQYSTPCFALAGIASVNFLGRKDLLEPSLKAMDWSCLTLSEGRAANHHEDFFPPVLAHALPMFKQHASPERYEKWTAQLKAYDPYIVYRSNPGRGNWNVVALSGEYLFNKLGIRDTLDFIEDSLAGQGGTFRSLFGLYLEGPMAYDHFPRLWVADMVANGYDDKYSTQLAEVLRRAALTSMFIQSPSGELPLGHRSAHHQWNEAEQCVTYEIYGARALRENQPELASAYKRAAHLAFSSMKRWQRPTGELYINKNKVEPEKFHGYEGYSGHSQYNLLPMAMLVMAYQHAGTTEQVTELPCPADVGGFVLPLPELHKVFANAGGTYVELETNPDFHYDVAGFARVHFKGSDPQLGPSDVLTTKTSYTLPKQNRIAAAIGPVWKNPHGKWRSLAETNTITTATVSNVQSAPDHVRFSVEYTGHFDGPASIIEHFDITPGKVSVSAKLQGYKGPGRIEWPVFADNGKEQTTVKVDSKIVRLSLGTSSQAFSLPDADSVSVTSEMYPNRNGWSRLGRADFADGTNMEMIIECGK